MRHATGELADCFDAFGLPESLLRTPALREVEHEEHDVAQVIPQASPSHQYRNPAPILAEKLFFVGCTRPVY